MEDQADGTWPHISSRGIATMGGGEDSQIIMLL
jgi:hypothetical protein